MQHHPSSDGKRKVLKLAAALALATSPLAGCSCLEGGWETYVTWDADAAEFEGDPDCSMEAIEQRSKESAKLAENADPKLLDEARREAEHECASKHRERAGAWQTSLK